MGMSKIKVAGALLLVVGVGIGVGTGAFRAAPAAPDAPKVAAAPPAKAKLPRYVIEPPDVLRVRYAGRPDHADCLVRPDGTIRLGDRSFVTCHVAGLTTEQAREAVAKLFRKSMADFDLNKLTVEVVAFNSKVFYVIGIAANGAEQVTRVPYTGNQTVIDAVDQFKLPASGPKRVLIQRITDGGSGSQTFPVDLDAITQRCATATNYLIMPGDRVYIKVPAMKEAEELEAIAKALREIQSPADYRRAIERLDAVTKKLREGPK